jgi:hypothetical protein
MPSGTIQVDGLTNGTTYYGVVEAVDGQNVSPPSAEFQVKPDISAPGKLIAVPGDGKAQLEFAPADGAERYAIQVLSGSNAVSSETTDQTAFKLGGLTNGSSYTVRVSSIGKGGIGTGYAEAVVTLDAQDIRFEDDFESADMTKYVQDVSQWTIENGLLKHVSGGDHQGELTVSGLQFIDGTLTAVAKHATSNADWGISFRGSSYANGYVFGFENGILFIRRDGQNLATPVPFTAKLGELYKLEVRLDGKRIRASVDGKQVFDVTDTVYTSGRVGLHSWADAQFAYLKAARDPAALSSKPEIYQAKAGSGWVALKYSEVDGADSYVIRYAPVTGSDAAAVQIPANPGSTIITGLQNGVAYSFTVAAVRNGQEAVSEPALATPSGNNGQPLFYVDAGDGTPLVTEEGETFGAFQTLEEQPYGKDPVTGIMWGYEADDGQTWAQTSPIDAYETIRQYDGNTNGKGLAYRFQIPNGTYKVTIGFFDPWTASDRAMDLKINGETKLSGYIIGSNREAKTFDRIAVTGGELVVKVVKAGGSKPMLSWIKIEQ